MNTRLRILLPLIFGGIHFLLMGVTILQTGGNGEGFAFSVLYADWPLLLLSQHCAMAICGNEYFRLDNGNLFILIAGTLMYALVGFLIGAVIDWVRTLVHRWGER